ncbi:MAG: hypothetical protein BEN19_09145 [Epulopiscium sp. Nuni2H_MBin003]|nr:MAG: hypothetical protein BEN19_09145 [Epulopiscium sp. Nuni2H_MBin003]
MRITELSVKRPVAIFILLLTLVIFAFDTLVSFKMASMPPMEMPMFIVQTTYIGANAETIENLVTEPIADIGKTIEGFDYSQTISEANVSLIAFMFDYGTDMDETYMDLRSAIDRVELPEDASDPYLIQMSLDSSTILQLAVSSTVGDDITNFIEETLVPEIETNTGVAEVDVYGVNPGYVKVEVDETALKQYNLSLAQVNSAIASAKFTIPAGSVSAGTQILSVSAIGEIESLYEIANMPIITATGKTVRVNDVATVEYAMEKVDNLSRYNGVDNLSLTVTATQDADVPSVAREILAICDKIMTDNPTIKIDVMSNEGQAIVDIIVSVGETLLIAVGFCMIVLFIFFGDIRASLIVGSSIPISLMLALIMMGYSNFELNSITGIALIIAIGMIVDSSIVVLESMFLYKKGAVTFIEAAIKGTKMVGTSLIASTITTIVVYLPLALMEGLSGQIFSQLGYTIVYSMLASIIAAITIVPLAFVLLKPKAKPDMLINRLIAWILKGYAVVVRGMLKVKYLAVLLAIGIIGVTGYIFTQLPMEMMPSMDYGYFSVSLNFRPGTNLDVMSEQTKIIEDILHKDEAIEHYYTRISGNTANIDAYLAEGYRTEEIVDIYRTQVTNIAGTTIDISVGGMMIPGSVEAGKRSITIESTRYEDVENVAYALIEEFYTYPEVRQINSSVSDGKSQFKLDIDSGLAATYGLSVAEVAQYIYMLNEGMSAGKMTLSGNEIDIKVHYPRESYDDINKILGASMTTQFGDVIIGELVDIDITNEPLSIDKLRGKYYIELELVFDLLDTAFVNQIVEDVLARGFENGVAAADYTTEEMIAELLAIGKAILTGAFLVFAVMAIQFESLRFSIMVMMSLAFGGIGAFSLIYFTGETISMTSLMGFLMLIGLAVNNGILYVDRVTQLRADMPIKEALIEAGCSRIRPILMTTMTTILSMIPIILGTGEASIMLRAMAMVIIGGLISSTILILILLPNFYLILAKKDKPQVATVDNQLSV